MSCVDQSFPELFITMLFAVSFVQLFFCTEPLRNSPGTISLCPSTLKILTCSWSWLCVPMFYQPKSQLFLSAVIEMDAEVEKVMVLCCCFIVSSIFIVVCLLYSVTRFFTAGSVYSYPAWYPSQSYRCQMDSQCQLNLIPKDKNLKHRNLKTRFFCFLQICAVHSPVFCF